MAAEYLANAVQEIALNAPAIFTASIPCRRGYVYHEEETGIFILRGITNQCPAAADPTVTPAPVIELQNANLVISRIA